MKLLKYGFYLLAIAASAVSCTRKDGKLYIALKENDGREPRKIGIGMTVGDAFTSIDITQGSALLTTPNE